MRRWKSESALNRPLIKKAIAELEPPQIDLLVKAHTLCNAKGIVANGWSDRKISHKPIEFQVRTELMHMEAEHGSAAHWRYKNDRAQNKGVSQKEWMRELLQRHERSVSLDVFLETLHRQVYSDQMVVFGNGGRIIHLPENATVRDYLESSIILFSQDTVVRVNGKAAGIDSRLQDGDSIEIIMGDKLKPQETAGAVFKARTKPIGNTDRT